MSSPLKLSVPSASGSVPGSARAPCDVVTLNHKGVMVYTDVADTYEGAIDKAVLAYDDLRNVPRERVTFSVRAKVNHNACHQVIPVRIAPTTETWTRVVRGLIRFEVVEVHVLDAKGQPEVAPPGYTTANPDSKPGSSEKDARLDVPQTAPARPSSPRLFVRLRDAIRGD
ncbi:hypothetical protein OF83DRAFT_767614 [Amylostereum chailletii]|nr:hypothetical protein OF83DRAFT_767614 [Amylostereum chailletii]